MLELGTYSVSAHTLLDHNALGVPPLGVAVGSSSSDGAPRRYVLQPPDPESWHKHRLGLVEGSRSCSLLEPRGLPESPVLRTASFDTLYRLRAKPPPAAAVTASMEALGLNPDMPVSPHAIRRRRGGLIEQRDIIRAHQAHKMQSTPQARRKEWE